MKCPTCGSENLNTSKFCFNCGTRLPEQITLNINTNQNMEYNYHNSDNSGQNNPGTNTGWAPFTAPPKPKWYTKTWFVILMLFLFFPVGLYLMWKHKGNWHIGVRVTVTLIILLMVFIPTESSTKKSDSRPTKFQEYSKKEEKKTKSVDIKENGAANDKENKNIKSAEKSEPETAPIPDYSTLSESDYKSQCDALSVYDIKDNAKNFNNKLVSIRGKVLQHVVDRSTQEEYLDFGVESVTDTGMYSYVSTPVYLKDCRNDKALTTNDGDVFTVYGISTIAYDYYYGHYTLYVDVRYIE